ncbi:MAG: PKD domain-containing protein [Bacteroidota bacterium]
MKQVLAYMAISLFSIACCYPQNQESSGVSQLAEINWNTPDGIPYVQDYGINRGADAFAVTETSEFAFLSSAETAIILFDPYENKVTGKIGLKFPAMDMVYHNGLFYLTGKSDIYILDHNGVLQDKIAYRNRMNCVERIAFSDKEVFLVSPGQESYGIGNTDIRPVKGIPLSENLYGYVEKKGGYEFTLKLTNGTSDITSFIFSSDKKLGTVRIMGYDNGVLYADVQYVVNEVPLKVEREIVAFNIHKSGITEDFRVPMPDIYYAYTRRDVICDNGNLYFLVSAPSAAKLFVLANYSATGKGNVSFPQDMYAISYHYNNHLKDISSLEQIQPAKGGTKAPITRYEIIANAEPYDTHVWYCNPENIKDYDCGGVHVTTPSWVQVGYNTSVPYMWGGWSKLPQFDQGLLNGVSAGDCYTVGGGSGSSCAVGVDCSGFVSVVWELPVKYGTSTLPNISTAYSSFDDLLPGDIVNYAGSHVRLVHTCYGSGSWLMIEASASATNWSVGYTPYTTADLQANYIPRYYADVINGPYDTIPPTTAVSAGTWETADFQANFTDFDNLSLDESFYMVTDYDGTEWRSNGNSGFFNDNFTTAIHADWTQLTGTWSIIGGALNQSVENNSNTNIYAIVAQQTGSTYLYQWKMKIGGSGANRRAGMYIFCDGPAMTQRNNSYMIYFRVDQNTCQIYKSTNDNIVLEGEASCIVNADQWYDCKVIFNTVTGVLDVFQDNELVASWTDSNPHTAANSISLRTGDCNASYDDIRVYRSRGNTETITVGTMGDARYENPSPAEPACTIYSIVIDSVGFFSDIDSAIVNIDLTPPADVFVSDGLVTDIDSTYSNSMLSGNWTASNDPNSGIMEYQYCIGDVPFGSNITGWTSNGTATDFTRTGLSLVFDSTYYISVKAVNNAGLESQIVCSDGQKLVQTTNTPEAEFTCADTNLCVTDSVTFLNFSNYATTYEWTFSGGSASNSSEINPTVYFPSGTYTVQLIATGPGGTDTLVQNITITLYSLPVSDFTAIDTTLNYPGANAIFTNSSLNANAYWWDFGDGATSSDENPWHEYMSGGVFDIILIAYNAYCSPDTLIRPGYIIVTDVSEIEEIPAPGYFSIFPNPAGNKFTISAHDIVKIDVIDINGKIIYSDNYGDTGIQRTAIDAAGFPAGIYLVRIITGNTVMAGRLIKN